MARGSGCILLLMILGLAAGSSFLLDGVEEIDQELYHSAPVLAQDYQDMLDRFKLYIYPAKKGAPDVREDLQAGADFMFFKCLVSSTGFVTDDPEKAHLFILPVSVSSISRNHGVDKVAHSLKGYIQQLRDFHPFWQRSLGADHAFVSCQDFKSDWSRNVLELKKNAIQIACFPLPENQDFFPHKDITMPGLQQQIEQSAGNEEEKENLAFYSADSEAPVPESWLKDEDFLALSLRNGSSSSAAYSQAIRSSQFCISLDAKDRQIIADALQQGCIPVIFSAGKLSELPFQDILDWNRFAIVLARTQLAHTRRILESINESRMSSLRRHGARAAKHMRWHSPPQPHDAFYMLLYQLWRRHYAIRYRDRTLRQ